jgi:hypothetical protein
MNPLTCPEVQEQIELYAAGECGAPEQAAIRQHLAHCPACFRIQQEAREMLGLLEVRLREKEGLQRLQARLRSGEDRPRSVKLLPFARRLSAVAAMLLLAVGLSVWFRSPDRFGTPNPLVLAWGPAPGVRNLPNQVEHHPAIAVFKKGVQTDRVFALDLKGKTAKEFRQELVQAKDALPEPPLVNLSLELRNTSDKDLAIHIGSKGSELRMDLKGPGVVTSKTADHFGADFLIPKTVIRKPGQTSELPISRLVFGSRENVQAAYWTEPGEYTLSLQYKVGISRPDGSDFRYLWLRSPPMHLQVQFKKK